MSQITTGTAVLAERPTADVLIIGGGINGIATFRDLALQGVDVVLVDRSDIVTGASAASSHMIHGGVRYLENGEFRLVHEAVTERNDLLGTAPHYVRPLQTTIPIFSTFSGILNAPLRFLRHGAGKPQERGAALIKIGLVIYDSFSRGGGRVPRHAFHGRKKSSEQLPQLNPGIKYTATYWDASMHDPERLAGDVARDGVRAGGRLATYAEVVAARGDAVVLRDADSGEELEFRAKVVINASGPWTDLTNTALGEPTRFMGGTKGSHIVIDDPALLEATGGREIFFEHSDGRIVLIYPLKGRVLIGTTDLEHDMADPIVCTEAEVDYFIELAAHVFPTIPVRRENIVYRFAGVRPLPRHGEEAPGFVSRDYRIEEARLGDAKVFSLVGGKWTTFRASAEHLADKALGVLGVQRRVSTRGLAIGGGKDFPTTERARATWVKDNAATVGADRASVLLTRYGTVAADVIAFIAKDDADGPLQSVPSYSTGELRFLADAERVRHLDDMLMRRTSMAFVGQVSEESAREVAEAVAPVLGWDRAQIEAEIERGLTKVNKAVPSAH